MSIFSGANPHSVYKNFSDEAVVTLGIVEEILHDKMPDESLCADLKYKCSYDVKSYDNGTGIIPSYLLRPELITKENYKEKLVDTGYYKLDKDGYPKVKQWFITEDKERVLALIFMHL